MPAFRAGAVPHGKLGPVDGVWVMELDGTAEERGRAAGTLVGEQVRWLLPRFLKQVASVERLSPYQKEMVAGIASEVPSAHFNQLNALAETAGVDRTALFAANLAPEAFAAMACSCLATLPARAGDGKTLLARNLDWQGGGLLAAAGLLVIESGHGHRFASFTWPGMVSVATGMNDAGLTVADLMALGAEAGRPRPGVPVLFLVRALLEETDSAEAALAYLAGARRTIPQNYTLVDPTSATFVEAGTRSLRVRHNSNGLAAMTNFWHEEGGGAQDRRYGQMLKMAGQDKLGVSQLQAILAEAALGDMNVQAVVLEPEARRAHVAQGKPPVAAGTWHTLDLRPWLSTPEKPPAVENPAGAGHRPLGP